MKPYTTAAPSRTALERDVQNEIREALGMEPGLVLIRNSVGVAREFDTKTHQTRTIRYGLGVGSADLVGCLDGRFFALEIKRPGEQATDDQVRWANMMRNAGAFVATVRSAGEARAALERARNGASR